MSGYAPLHDHAPSVGMGTSEEMHSESDVPSGTTLGSTRREYTHFIPSPGSAGSKPPKLYAEEMQSESDDRFSGTTLGSTRFRGSTDLIPTPGFGGSKPPKRFEPIMLQLWFIILTPSLMLLLGLALEIAIYISGLNHGFAVPQSNVFAIFGNVTGQFLASFFPTLLIMPFAFAWRELDWLIRSYQPYVVLQKGNAKAEESLLLDYITLGPILAIPRAMAYKHRIVLWSSITACLTYIYQPLTGSIFQIQQAQQTSIQSVTGTNSIGLAPDSGDLNSFMAAAGYVDASVLFGLPDPPFVDKGWATAEVIFPANPFLNGSLSVNTAGIETTANCSNSVGPTLLSGPDTSLTASSTSIDGCVQNMTFDSTAATLQYGVRNVPCPGNASSLDVQFQPVMFWFFHKTASNQNEVNTIFCTPIVEAFEVKATANLNNGQLLNVTRVGDFKQDNNVTGFGIDQPPAPVFNGVIFENSSNPFIQARVVATPSLVAGAIFRAAQQKPNGPDSTFVLPTGFLDLTSFYYTRHLSTVAKSVYFVNQNTTLNGNVVALFPRLVIDPLPAHALAVLLILTGIIGIYLHINNRRQRKTLLLAAPPGSIASITALTARSGFGELLLPYDNELTLEKKLDGIRFRLDRRTGAIVADDYETERAGMGRDDALLSLLGKGPNDPISATSHSSSYLAYQAAHGSLPWAKSWTPVPVPVYPPPSVRPASASPSASSHHSLPNGAGAPGPSPLRTDFMS